VCMRIATGSILLLRAVLFQLDRPVGVVEELFPASVAFVAEMNVDEGIFFGFYRFFHK